MYFGKDRYINPVTKYSDVTKMEACHRKEKEREENVS